MPGFTAELEHIYGKLELWIDYILYFYARLYSHLYTSTDWLLVVNWLHFVFLCPALQLNSLISICSFGCELITFCIFMPGFTAGFWRFPFVSQLWIDYILYFYARLYSGCSEFPNGCPVVNWLHFVFLCPALQPNCSVFPNSVCCELITFCIFMPGFTARHFFFWLDAQLWIDYILYFYARLYSSLCGWNPKGTVVNWLHFVFLCPALQHVLLRLQLFSRCELITFCIFMPGFTALASQLSELQ